MTNMLKSRKLGCELSNKSPGITTKSTASLSARSTSFSKAAATARIIFSDHCSDEVRKPLKGAPMCKSAAWMNVIWRDMAES